MFSSFFLSNDEGLFRKIFYKALSVVCCSAAETLSILSLNGESWKIRSLIKFVSWSRHFWKVRKEIVEIELLILHFCISPQPSSCQWSPETFQIWWHWYGNNWSEKENKIGSKRRSNNNILDIYHLSVQWDNYQRLN